MADDDDDLFGDEYNDNEQVEAEDDDDDILGLGDMERGDTMRQNMSNAGGGERPKTSNQIDAEDDFDPNMYLEEEKDAEDEDNKLKDDGTRERNLTLWEAAPWHGKMYAVLESGSFASDIPAGVEKLAFTLSFSMMGIILVSCASVLIESYPQYVEGEVPIELQVIEVLCVVVFTFDMVVRLITAPDKLAYAMDLLNWIDLVAVLPFYIENFGGVEFVEELRIVRVLRLVRIFRIFRMLKRSNIPGLAAVLEALRTSLFGITLFIALGGVVLLIMSTSAYYAERGTRKPYPSNVTGTNNTQQMVWFRRCHRSDGCYDEITPFQSIPDAFWWGINTMSTVGLGDVVTKTPIGRFVACITMVSGILIIAFPTMILSGNFDAARGQQRLINIGWEDLEEFDKNKKTESPKTAIQRKMGWLADEEEDLAVQKQKAAEAKAQQMEKLKSSHGNKVPKHAERELEQSFSMEGTMLPAINRSGLKTQGGRRSRRRRDKDVAKAIGSFTFNHMPFIVKRDPINKHAYFYDPLFQLAVCDDGGPAVRVIWGICGQPTVVKLTLIMDHVDARESAVHLVQAVDGIGSVRCDLGGGFEVKHYASRHTGTDPTEPCPFVLNECRTTGAYRNSDCPLYFRWTKSEELLKDLDEDQVAELALSHLLGTTLFITHMLPEPLHVHRLPIVQQVTHHTKLQRELEIIAKAPEFGGDLYAYVSKGDVEVLLEGVSTKVIVSDTTLTIEDRRRLDRIIVDKLLSRIRVIPLRAVPPACKKSIYNAEFLGPADPVYEFPISLFQADELDEVEEDAIGYVDVKLRPFLSRCLRVDIKMDHSVEPHEEDDEDDDQDDDAEEAKKRESLLRMPSNVRLL